MSLTPSQDVIYGSKTEINCTGHGDHISLKLVRAATNQLLAVGTGNVSVLVNELITSYYFVFYFLLVLSIVLLF